MKRFIGVLVIILVIIAGYFFFFRNTNPPIKNTHPTGTTIVALGDSLTAGVGASDKHDYVTLLSQKLGVAVINKGVSGDTTAQALARVPDVLSADPKIVIVLLGGNDAIQKVPKEETFSNLHKIINKIQSSGALVILVGVQGGLLSDHFRSDFDKLARETQSVYVPNILENIIGKEGYMYDYIHPNDKGYEIVAERIYEAMKPYVGG
jgi:acyl-CoA thioesterase-1